MFTLSVAAAVFATLAVWCVVPPTSFTRLMSVVAPGQQPVVAFDLETVWVRLRRLAPGGARREGAARRRGIEAIATFASDLRSGQPMRPALLSALDGVAPQAVAAAQWGGDVPAALRGDAQTDGFEQWRFLAACWEVSETSGAGLASALDRLSASARAGEEVRVQLKAHLAAPRATAQMLATLPLIGLLLGLALGGDPLAWLLGTPGGLICLVAGVALTALGLWWVHRIARGVEQAL